MTVSQETLKAGLSKTLDGTNFESLGRKYEGKVRVQAEVLRQIAKDRFAARNARFTTSRMGLPGYMLRRYSPPTS